MNTKHRTVLAIAIPLFLGPLALITAPVASAASTGALSSCRTHSWSNKDSGTGNALPPSAPLRKGPSSHCSVNGTVYSASKLQYDCYVVNSAGNTWTHARLDVPLGLSGWIWDFNLDDGGSTKRC
ncbi:SH3 domain-containing protein [Streptomyces sp. NPDC091280]|uniref:SH3 domain-containing protein n=1 Tax=Streptomyces sp. NPDC091280 TaxID=3365984 RepID=UPI00380BD1BD